MSSIVDALSVLPAGAPGAEPVRAR